jgi:hypothetical protein
MKPSLAIVLAAIAIPAIAAAQSADPNYDPNAAPSQQPQPAPNQTPPVTPQTAPVTQEPAPPAPVTTTTTTTTPPPVVIVNPTAPAPRTTTTYVAPEGEVVEDNWNAPVFVSGAVIFGASYGAAAIASSESDHPGANRLWVPVVGPWLALNDWGSCPIENPSCDTNTTDKVLLVADGVFQAAGIITMVDGLLSPSHHRVVTRTADTKVHVTPTGHGLAVFGHF